MIQNIRFIGFMKIHINFQIIFTKRIKLFLSKVTTTKKI
jgi:hypothetical protein